ncbi:hypothetical protein SRHO_G00316160 [Serrasalmus rhombeus]
MELSDCEEWNPVDFAEEQVLGPSNSFDIFYVLQGNEGGQHVSCLATGHLIAEAVLLQGGNQLVSHYHVFILLVIDRQAVGFPNNPG